MYVKHEQVNLVLIHISPVTPNLHESQIEFYNFLRNDS
jgi:hypothetical protein